MSKPKYTLEQYEDLKAAYATGTLSVKYGEQATTFHSSKEMRAILTEMENELGLSKPRGVLQRHVTGVYSKGL